MLKIVKDHLFHLNLFFWKMVTFLSCRPFPLMSSINVLNRQPLPPSKVVTSIMGGPHDNIISGQPQKKPSF